MGPKRGLAGGSTSRDSLGHVLLRRHEDTAEVIAADGVQRRQGAGCGNCVLKCVRREEVDR